MHKKSHLLLSRNKTWLFGIFATIRVKCQISSHHIFSGRNSREFDAHILVYAAGFLRFVRIQSVVKCQKVTVHPPATSFTFWRIFLYAKMFFIVKLKNTGEKKIIPSKWIHHLNLYRLLKYGVVYERKHEYKIFISPNGPTIEPDFALDVLDIVDGNRDACYLASIHDVFSELFRMIICSW